MSPKELVKYLNMPVLPMSKINLLEDYPVSAMSDKVLISILDPKVQGTEEDLQFNAVKAGLPLIKHYTLYVDDFIGTKDDWNYENIWLEEHHKAQLVLPDMTDFKRFINTNIEEHFIIHCTDGESRSVAVAYYLAYLKHDLMLFEHLGTLPKVTPNLWLLCQLLGLDASVQGGYYQVMNNIKATLIRNYS